MIVRFVKGKEVKSEKNPGRCLFCGTTMEETYPGDHCSCGAVVTGIYGDKAFQKKEEE